MKTLFAVALAATMVAVAAQDSFAWVKYPGLENRHPLKQAQVGELLVNELRCTACHVSTLNSTLQRSSPDLSDVGSRIEPSFLKRFLINPSLAHANSAMPDMLSSFSESERTEVAEALTHYLIAQSARPFQAKANVHSDGDLGKQLFHTVGCVACHSPREEKSRELTPEEQARKEVLEDVADPDASVSDNTAAVDLSHVPSKFSSRSLSEFLFQPLKVRSAGRMPDMKLNPQEAQAIAGYLLMDQPKANDALIPDEKLVERGRMHFVELNCVACHRLGDAQPKSLVVALQKADPTRGCIASQADVPKVDKAQKQVALRSPRYSLTEEETQAILAALKEPVHADSDDLLVAKTLTTFNCIACHVRDEYGGVAEDRNAYFETSEKNLGEDGRIPPPLTLLGAKLRPEWLKKVLFDGESVRPYMSTRMPQFGEQNLRHLPELVHRVDRLESEPLDIPSPESDTREKTKEEREREKLLRAAGRELLGQQGVYCVACHNFNGKLAPVNKGIDLMTTFERLQPGWFNNFVRNPGKYRPRIVMPYSWPDGAAAHDKILDGNTQMQIEAIWYYLSLGTSAADPPGIRRVDTVLSVGDTARTYRGRSSVAGYRGIAVGFPEKLNYAFNAETGTLAAIWQGEFIRVDRGGQGSGGFNPAAPAVQLMQDVSFARLKSNETPWPTRPVMSKEAPVNSDPLYPKNLGYQFKGYYLDDTQVPTFMYRTGQIAIEDRSLAVRRNEQLELVRSIQFNSPENTSIWFRALTGETEKLQTDLQFEFATDKLRLTIPRVANVLRPVKNAATPDGSTFELLLQLEIPKGQSTLSLTYELLKKQ